MAMAEGLRVGSSPGHRDSLPQPAPHTVLCESPFAVSAE